jgi:hypothetical protein
MKNSCLALVFTVTAACPSARGSDFADDYHREPTISRLAKNNDFVVYGYFKNPREKPQPATDFVILKTAKSHPKLQGRKQFAVPAYLPVGDERNPPRGLLIGAIIGREPGVAHHSECSDAFADFVQGLVQVDSEDRVATMKYCFPFLENADEKTAEFAFYEFATSPDKDIAKAARTFSPKSLRLILKNDKTRKAWVRLYGFLLGHCGTDEDARLLRGILDRGRADPVQNLDGVLEGYILLQPDEAWAFIERLVIDKNAHRSFRYAILDTIRFLGSTRPDLIAHDKRLAVMRSLLAEIDIADAVIERLRAQGEWRWTADVLPLWSDKEKNPKLEWRILRYALDCPEPSARQFIENQRRINGEAVLEHEESLRLERRLAAQNIR